MIIGVGIDLVEISRITKANINANFAQKILTPSEILIYTRYPKARQIEFLAGRFATKEAFAKAMGSGIGKDFMLHDLSVLSNKRGAPIVEFSERFEKKVNKNKLKIHISITHIKDLAQAIVIIEKLI